jgi:flap endonuclease-1
MIKDHGSIEEALPHLPEKLRNSIPDDWKFDEARRLFSHPDVTSGDTIDLKWEAPDVEAVVDFLVKEKGFR